jgi:hypothetical protein
MFQHIYDSDYLAYRFIEKSGEFILTSKKFKINYTLAGEFAVIFREHLELINCKQDETLNKRIERLIGIHIYYGISSALDMGEKNIPRFID